MNFRNEHRRFRAIRLILPVMMVVAAANPAKSQQERSIEIFVHEFNNSKVFWKQLEVGKRIVALRNVTVPRSYRPISELRELEPLLSAQDRHARGNAGFVFAGMGDDRGFDVITAILRDRSERPEGQCACVNRWSLEKQIRSDRYYAAHLFGDLKDARAVPILIPLLRDEEVNHVVPWALGEIGDTSAIPPLIQTLSDKDPDMRVLGIHALEKLDAKQALPKLQSLLHDDEKSHFGQMVSVAEAARAAIAKLDVKR